MARAHVFVSRRVRACLASGALPHGGGTAAGAGAAGTGRRGAGRRGRGRGGGYRAAGAGRRPSQIQAKASALRLHPGPHARPTGSSRFLLCRLRLHPVILWVCGCHHLDRPPTPLTPPSSLAEGTHPPLQRWKMPEPFQSPLCIWRRPVGTRDVGGIFWEAWGARKRSRKEMSPDLRLARAVVTGEAVRVTPALGQPGSERQNKPNQEALTPGLLGSRR